MAPVSATLNDLDGHFSYMKPFKSHTSGKYSMYS